MTRTPGPPQYCYVTRTTSAHTSDPASRGDRPQVRHQHQAEVDGIITSHEPLQNSFTPWSMQHLHIFSFPRATLTLPSSAVIPTSSIPSYDTLSVPPRVPTSCIRSSSSTTGYMPTLSHSRSWSEPPPLDHGKSPYGHVRLPDMASGPVAIHPLLEYAPFSHVTARRRARSVSAMEARKHRCAPATSPILASLTFLLPKCRPVTVHASSQPDVVLVGDVMRALDNCILSKAEALLVPPEVVACRVERDKDMCPCLGGVTALDFLRSRHGGAGFVPTKEGYDIWELVTGVH